MSIFPAYCEKNEKENNEDLSQSVSNPNWLENESFNVQDEVNKIFDAEKADSSSSTSSSSDANKHELMEDENEFYKSSKSVRTKKNTPVYEFTGAENYYIDKTPSIVNIKKHTISKKFKQKNSKKLRYFQNKLLSAKIVPNLQLNEDEYTTRLAELNRATITAPGEIQHWLELIELQDRNPYKMTRLAIAEKRVDIIKRALVYLPRNNILYSAFVNAISDSFPSYEVSARLDSLIAKDSTNYTLWLAQILCTQTSMAKCNVPDVLKLYRTAMSRMHHANLKASSNEVVVSDDIMLALFYNCALFLRQAGHFEQLFALIKLSLELNISIDGLSGLAPLDADHHTLIEYEEMILGSGLPMNEIWLRIEKLRQGFNFLPYTTNVKCSDPERIVLNEDICHYAYPLKSPEESFKLMLLIFRLLKLPFIETDSLAKRLSLHTSYASGSDAIEDVFITFLRGGNFVLKHDEMFLNSLYELVKEMAVNPTFVCTSIGHEIYIRSITDLLKNCAAFYDGKDERKRIALLMLYCRFERVLLLIQKVSKKLTAEYVKAGRSKFKSLLKLPQNRNVINLYTELGIYEFEALKDSDDLSKVKSIFENIAANNENEIFSSDLCHLYATYAEILIQRKMLQEAIKVLCAFGANVDTTTKDTISDAKKLAALKNIREKLEILIKVEQNVKIMVLEQYLLPDHVVSLIKMHALLQWLMCDKPGALSFIDSLTNLFCDSSDRHIFLREQILQVSIVLTKLGDANSLNCNNALNKKISLGLEQFPSNMWLKLRWGVEKTSWCTSLVLIQDVTNVYGIIFTIAKFHCKFLMQDFQSTEFMYSDETIRIIDEKYAKSLIQNRIVNIFKMLVDSSSKTTGKDTCKALLSNSLFWRLYLRCLSDEYTDFEKLKECLLTSLDNCPWSKVLYLDGGTYVPQQLSHLQDLIIEKQLRLYALPEELHILRQE
ncbi:uncharacterized protein LOC119671864 [Teleopsis dalmanni]|uniref:uncharacterized protein LOC119671864 n=1 Tax=Teleopsis dalmanni TaxID=139649 RepID=UPI0018CFAE5F|nr:uncharacterized protein LOC119671864 [Teleopsis dalmanni]